MPDQEKVVIARPDWARFWSSFVIVPRNPFWCSVCRRMVEPGKSLINENKLFCGICAKRLYDVVRHDLDELEETIRRKAESLGHSLTKFKPGHLNDRKTHFAVAQCIFCGNNVCYGATDMVRDWDCTQCQTVITSKPIGYPIIHKCPKKRQNQF